MTQLFMSLEKNKQKFDHIFQNSADYYFKYIKIFNIKCGLIMCDDLTDSTRLGEVFLNPLNGLKGKKEPIEVYDYIKNETSIPFDQTEATTFEDCIALLTGGFAIIIVDGVNRAISMSVQGYPTRGINEVANEGNLRASKEGFTEASRKNMALIRRKIRSQNLVMKSFKVGDKTKTEVIVCYHADYCPKELSNKVIERLTKVNLPIIFETGYIAPFIDRTKGSLFQSTGYTERPDTFCAKICEGKVGILVDGTPYAMIYPYFFHENFITNDDYTQRPYFASFLRILRYVAFLIAVALPGVYVAFSSYAPQALTSKLIFFVYSSQYATPLPLFVEAVLITILFEIIKEAGLRLPSAIGSSLSLVSALIIGDAAINAGLIGSAILIVCAISTISSFIIPSFYEPITILRMVYIVLAGVFGIAGIAFATLLLFVNIVKVRSGEIDYAYMLNITKKSFYSDILFRSSWRNSKGNYDIKESIND